MSKFIVTYPKPSARVIDKWFKDLEGPLVELASIERQMKALAAKADKAGKKISETISAIDNDGILSLDLDEEKDLVGLTDEQYQAWSEWADLPEKRDALDSTIREFAENRLTYGENEYEIENIGDRLKEAAQEIFDYASETLREAKDIAKRWKAIGEDEVELEA